MFDSNWILRHRADTEWWMLTKIRLARICELYFVLITVNDIHRLSAFTWADWCLLMCHKFVTTFFFFFMLCVKSGFAHEFVATIIKINDGDTISAIINSEDTKIRLLDVDCYETKKNKRANFQHEYYGLSYNELIQKGKQSRKILKEILKDHRYIRVKWEKRDSFGRILGNVKLDDIKSVGVIDVNRYMLNQGNCNKYVPSSVLKLLKK